MGIGTILIGVALVVIVLALIVSPLLEQRRPAITPSSPREAMEAEHQATLRAIREIDLDYRTHKLSDEDYKMLRAKQVAHGADVLRALDNLKGERQIDEEIEQQVAAIRQTATAPGFCPQCGKPVGETDRFCANCGAALEPKRQGARS